MKPVNHPTLQLVVLIANSCAEMADLTPTKSAITAQLTPILLMLIADQIANLQNVETALLTPPESNAICQQTSGCALPTVLGDVVTELLTPVNNVITEILQSSPPEPMTATATQDLMLVA